MSRKWLWLGILLTLSLALPAFAAISTIPLRGADSELTLLSDRYDTYEYKVSLGSLVASDIATKGGDFTRLQIPGFHLSHIEGAPELPMMNRLLTVPFGATARIEITKVDSRTIDLAEYGITSPIMPAQPSVSKSADLDNLPFIHDAAAYATDKVARELVRVVNLGTLRSYDLARLEISPVEYLPRENKLVVHENIEFRVVFDGADKAADDARLAATWSPFFAPVYRLVDGAKINHFDHPDLVGDRVKMVIVTPPEFEYQLADFVQWKTERGFDVVMGIIGSPEVGGTTATIQAYLHGLYNAATPADPAPSFVLFVGDIAQCPTFSQAAGVTDRLYCTTDGDLYPEMYYGRFSATNSSQLQAILDKTMMYDQFTMPDPSYLANVTMIAGVDGSYAPTYGNGQINYGTVNYFNASNGITSNTYLYPASDAASAPAEIVQTVSDGVGYINYTAHGSTTSWSDPSFTQANINSLTNAGKYTLAVGNCCLTSSYEQAECFAETWLRAPNKGAIGYIGGSNSTYWDEDYWWGVGYHASSEIDGTAYSPSNTGIGAYDGYFHNNGEAPEQWYVTNDALNFCGLMTVTEAGSSRETYYWDIYNLMGDPSLSTFIGVPDVNPVSHYPTFFSNAVSIDVDAAPGSYVGLTQNGVLMASGTIDPAGKATFPLNGLLMPGECKLVVMMQNYEPYIATIPVIVPATVTIDPMVIDANVTTAVTVTVIGEDGVTPVVGLDVWAEGLGYASATVATDASGVAVLSVNYPFGPELEIVGKNAADPYFLFRETIGVNALALTAPDLTVATDIGMSDMFPLNLPGTLTAVVGEPGATLYAVLPDGSELSTAAASLVVTPAQTGQVTGIIAVSGYDLYTEAFDVIEAYGQLTGTINVPGATVRLMDGGVQVLATVADGAGAFDFGQDILVDGYTVMVDHFGWLHYESPYFVNFGANTHDITMIAAPSGVLTGVIDDAVDGTLLQGTVRVYRSDNNALLTETTSDPVTGVFTTDPMPYFNYTVVVRAYHHMPVVIAIEISEPVVEKDFSLEQTNGDLLVIDDNAAAKALAPKFDEKGNLLAAGYQSDDGKAVDTMVNDLEYLGYSITVQTLAATDPATWDMYDMLVVSSGDNTVSLDNVAFRTALIAFVEGGGHLLLEGGEVGYDHYSSGAFAEKVMHTVDWNHDASGTFEVADPTHYVMSVPNGIGGGNPVAYVGYGDQDAMVPLPDAVMVGTWGDYPTDASVIAFDPNPAPEGGQIVFFTFNYAALETGCAQSLIQNAVNWLLTPEFGTSSISGVVNLYGETDHSGILVEALPGGGSTVTGADGSFSFSGLYGATYQIRASKPMWGAAVVEVPLADGENVTGISLVLTSVNELEVCSAPALAIPDNTPAGVSDVITIAPLPGATITAVEAFVDVTHTWQGDLLVNLTSPDGTMVTLHNRTGSSADNIYGWYPAELVPAGDLGAFIGETMSGDWTLTISDNAGSDTGVLNEWCVKVTYAVPVTSVAGAMAGFQAADGVQLTWFYQPGAVDGFHIYRRVNDGAAVRLTEEPVASLDGRLDYVDAVFGLPEGTVVNYSYAAVVDGVEQGRSVEFAITLTGVTPARYVLHANYPNPFNPSTRVRFELREPGRTTAFIYDLQGRLVKRLVDEVLPAAAHERVWNGMDDGGRRVASGTYYLKLQSGSFQSVQKMMLVK